MTYTYASEEVTGWIPETTREFSNEVNFKEIRDWAALRVDSARLAYFTTYAQTNFSGPLIYGMGTEHILGALNRWGAGCAWLDLGAGTSTLFWACALESVQSITAVDVSPEALVVLNQIVESSYVPQCYRDALAIYDLPDSHLARLRSLQWRYLVFDFSQLWPVALHGSSYDLMTAFGCFGLADGPDHFRRSVAHATVNLAPGGTIIGANWLRTPDAITAKGYDTSFLSAEFVAATLKACGLEVCQVAKAPIKAEKLYEAIIVWVGRKSTPLAVAEQL